MKKLLNYFKKNKSAKDSAALARERLQIIISHQRVAISGPDYIPMLQQELLEVIAKYVQVERDQVNVALEKKGDRSILELNIALPDLVDAL
ncbi:MAG: cell division topological specificity factor MinE [Gammaproteobacteria bacterium]